MRACVSAMLMLIVVSTARAERPPQPKKDATEVLVGTVEKIATKESPFGGDGVRTDYTAEVKVEKVERGERAKVGETFKVKWYHVTKRPSGRFVGAFGHSYGVKEKDAIRAYLIKGPDGDLVVIYNREGIEKMKK